jgi:hypothetical protein
MISLPRVDYISDVNLLYDAILYNSKNYHASYLSSYLLDPNKPYSISVFRPRVRVYSNITGVDILTIIFSYKYSCHDLAHVVAREQYNKLKSLKSFELSLLISTYLESVK